ncbi:MAG: response regulator, partial [Lachnospiraceae bacterium]|nr:response regulator [Lachnospiraceae bacterium]
MDKKVLLIADDEEMNRKIISKFLKNSYEILEATNGKMALTMIREQHVDVVILDIIMPEMDGLEVLEHVRARREWDAIGVLVATSTKEQTERTALSLGADDVVSKPYDPLVIRKRLENILAVKELQMQKKLLQNADSNGDIRTAVARITMGAEKQTNATEENTNIMLIVDDMKMNREILRALFESEYEIMEAESGVEALATLERCQSSIDIVLLDLMMKGVTGFDVLEKKSELNYFKNIPVIVITGSEHLEDQIKAFELGANDFINKPFVPEIVKSRVSNVMTNSRRMVSIEMEAQKLKIKSEVDEMTGLYNKTTTELMSNEVLKKGNSILDALLIIDIDNFKTVNDTMGHQEGDYVIKQVSDILLSSFRKSDIVGRIGGDEFCVVMVDVPDKSVIYHKINELIQIMRFKPNINIPEYVTLSIGVATNEKKRINYADLFKKADSALYLAKKGGKGQYREYGVEFMEAEEDKRSVVVLLSDQRNVCGAIYALLPGDIRVVEVNRLEELADIEERVRSKVKFLYADVSRQEDHGRGMWEELI